MNYVDLEDLVFEWLLTTSVADLAVKDNRVQIYLGMPAGSPKPVVVLSRVGGAPSGTSELSQDTGRISFAVWGDNRRQAKAIAKALVNECEGLAVHGKYESADGFLEVGDVLSWLWLPDTTNARYIVDVLFTSLGK